jgi:hypothetical protein
VAADASHGPAALGASASAGDAATAVTSVDMDTEDLDIGPDASDIVVPRVDSSRLDDAPSSDNDSDAGVTVH